MNHAQLNQAWREVEAVRPADGELCVNPVGIHSEGSDICVGRDTNTRRHFLVPLPLENTGPPSFKSSGLLVYARPLLREGTERVYLDLVCLCSSSNDIFSHLVLDVLQRMRPDEPDAAKICCAVLEEWKELFGFGAAGMGKEQTTGLVGELVILERLTALNPSALMYWDGPAGGIHDFRHGRRGLEVKASALRHGRLFSISGHQQLEAPSGGDLHFAALKLEQNPGGAISIPVLLEKIRRHGVSPSLLLKKLSDIGYAQGESVQADAARFDVSECRFYSVDGQFPRVIASTFIGGQPPSGVVKISYTIDLSADVPTPLAAETVDSFLHAFALGGLE